PDKRFEIDILKSHQNIKDISNIEPVATKDDILAIQEKVDNLMVHDDIYDYIVNIVNTTRNYEDLKLGASPRASIDLLNASKAKAFIHGRNYVIPDDVKAMAIPVLNHRLVPSPEARIERKTMEEILNGVLSRVHVPVIANE